jgi:hypothetical protein
MEITLHLVKDLSRCMGIEISSLYKWKRKIYCTVYYSKYSVETSVGIIKVHNRLISHSIHWS